MLIHWAALAFAFINSTIVLLVPLYALHLGYPGLTIGILAALPSITNVTLRLTVGQLSDRHGETKVLQAGGLFYLAATIGLLLATHVGLAALVGAQLLQGVGRSIFWTVGQTYVTKLPLQGGRNLSLFNGSSNLGMLLGMSAAGLWVAALGYRGAFMIVVAFALGYSALTFALQALSTPDLRRRTVHRPTRFAVPNLRLGPLWFAACCSFVSAATMALAASFYPVFLARLHYGERSIGLLVMLLAAGMLGISFVARPVVERIGRLEHLALVSIAGTGLGVAAVPAFHGWLPLAMLLFATGFCSGGCNLIYQLSVQRHSTWDARGAAMASVGLFGNLALLVLPTMIGVSLRWVSLEVALVAAGGFLISLGVIAGVSAGGVARPALIQAVPATGPDTD